MELRQIRKKLVGKYLMLVDTASEGADKTLYSLIENVVREGSLYRVICEDKARGMLFTRESLQCLAEGHNVVYYEDNREDIELALESGLYPPEYEINVQVFKVTDEEDTYLKELLERCIEES